MKKYFNVITLSILLALGAVLLTTNEVGAQNLNRLIDSAETAEESTDDTDDQNGDSDEDGSDNEQFCESFKTSINRLIPRLERRRDNTLNRYNNRISRWETTLSDLESRGVDTTEVRNDLEDFKNAVNAYETDFNAFINALNEAQEVDCQENPNQYFNRVVNALSMWDDVRTQIRDLNQKIKDIQSKINELKRDGREDRLNQLRCEQWSLRYDREAAISQVRRDHNIKILEHRKEVITESLNRLDERGVDTSEPRTMLEELQTKIDELAALYDEHIAKVQAAQAEGCEDWRDFRDTLRNLKDERKDLIRGKRREIRRFIRDINRAIREARRDARQERREARRNGNGRGGNNDNDTEQVTICHVPPGNPDARQTIEVDEPAVENHLAHGDSIGECEDEDDSDNGDENGNSNGNDRVTQLRCERIGLQYDRLIRRAGNQRDNTVKIFEKRKETILARLDRMDERGIDTTKPREILTEVDPMLAELSGDYDQLISDLEETKGQECNDPREYRDDLRDLRDRFREIRSQKREVRKKFREVNRAIREARREFRQERGNGNGNGDSNGDSDDSDNGV